MLNRTLLATGCAVATLAFTASPASAKWVNGVKVEDNSSRHSGADDFVNGVKLRGDGSVDDNGPRRNRGGRGDDSMDSDDDDRGGKGRGRGRGRGQGADSADDEDDSGRGRGRGRGRGQGADSDDLPSDGRGRGRGRGRGGREAPPVVG